MCQVDAGGEVQLPELAAMVVWRSRGEAALGVGGGGDSVARCPTLVRKAASSLCNNAITSVSISFPSGIQYFDTGSL